MNSKVLLLVSSDPRTSHRPAEGLRIAAGVGTWKKADFTVYLHGPAILALGEWVDDLVQEDDYVRYLPILKDPARPIRVEKDSPFLKDLGEATLPFEPLDPAGLAALAARHDYILRF